MKKLICAAAIALMSLSFAACSDDDEVNVDKELITKYCTTYHTCISPSDNTEARINTCIQAEVDSANKNGKCLSKVQEYHKAIADMTCDALNADHVKEKACRESTDNEAVKACMIKDTKYGKAFYDAQACLGK